MAEEIVKIITIDTRKSERSIKDLKDDIKALKKELESTTIGSKEFDLKLTQLGKLQKEYKAINEEIVASSKPVQKQMFELARFGENLAKSYSAINAAIGLLSDGNEDVQKALLKTSQMIQLIQGISGFAPMLRDIPKLIDNFKSWFKWLDPINNRINNIASKIAGIDSSKLNIPQGSSSAAASSGSGDKDANVEADAEIKNANAVAAAYNQQSEELAKLKKQKKEWQKLLKDEKAEYKALNKYIAENKDFNAEIAKIDSRLAEIQVERQKQREQGIVFSRRLNNEVKKLTAQKGELQQQQLDLNRAEVANIVNQKNIQEALKQTDAQIKATEKSISILKTRMRGQWVKNFLKQFLANAAMAALMVALAALIAGIVKLYKAADNALVKWRKLNKEIALSANTISSKGVVALKDLAKRYKEVGDTAEAKKKFLSEFKEEIQETGLAIRNVSEADEAFINNTDAYIQALKDRAKAQAIQSKAVELYQEYLDKVTKKENSRKGRQAAEDKQLAEDLVDVGVISPEEAEAVGTTTKLGKKFQQMEKEIEETLDRLFEEMYELEERSDPYFAEVEEGAADAAKATADAKADELAQLKQFYDDALKLLMDARTRELQEVEDKYAEQIALAKKHNQDTSLLERAKQREIDEIIKKYEDERIQKQKENVEQQLQVLQQQIERIRQMNDTSNLQEPQEQSFITKYHQGFGKAFMAGSTFFYQSAEDIENQVVAQMTYNNKILELTKSRIEQENELLNKQLEIEGITADRRLEIERTLKENEMALSDAYIKNEADNIAAYRSLQEKKNSALQNSLSVASEIFGAMATIAGEETKAGKAFAVTGAIIDTYASANAAYSAMAGIPYVGPALGIAAAAAAVASGIANVKTILSTQVSSDLSSVSISSGSVAPPPALSTPPIEYTRNLLGDKETDEINKPIKCYVLESDITETQNKVKVTEDNASF